MSKTNAQRTRKGFTVPLLSFRRVLRARYPGVNIAWAEIHGEKNGEGDVLFAQEIICYIASKDALLNAGLATNAMFEASSDGRRKAPATPMEYARTFSLDCRSDGFFQLTYYTECVEDRRGWTKEREYLGGKRTLAMVSKLLKQFGVRALTHD